jgi:Leucine-rich repeat (LRR) protein
MIEQIIEQKIIPVDILTNTDELDGSNFAIHDIFSDHIIQLVLSEIQKEYAEIEEYVFRPNNNRIFDLVRNFQILNKIRLYEFGDLGKISTNLENLHSLKDIYLSTWFIPTVEFRFPKELEEFNYYSYYVPYFPFILFDFLGASLQRLSIYCSKMTHIPENVFYLKNLQKLNVRGHIEELPAIIENLRKLEILLIRNNDIKILPESLGRMKNLKVVNLCFNKINDFSILEGLENLEELQIRGNNIAIIPKVLENKTIFEAYSHI